MIAEGFVFMGVGLDGFIAGPNGELDRLAPFNRPDENTGFIEFLASIDVVALGRPASR